MGLPALQDDYLFLGVEIRDRLAAQIADTPAEVVETTAQLLAADRRERVLMVMWAGDGFGDDAARGSSQKVRQRWMVVVGLNNVAQQPDARQSLAGPLLSRVHRALAGWAPASTATLSFRRAPASLRPEFTPQRALYPLGFEIQLSL